MWKKLDAYHYENTVTGAFLCKMSRRRIRSGYVYCLYESKRAFLSFDAIHHPFAKFKDAQAAGSCIDNIKKLFTKAEPIAA